MTDKISNSGYDQAVQKRTVGGFGFKRNDGKPPGGKAYGSDCAIRAIAIATGLSYASIAKKFGKSYTSQRGTMNIGASDCLRRLGWKHIQASTYGPNGITPMTLKQKYVADAERSANKAAKCASDIESLANKGVVEDLRIIERLADQTHGIARLASSRAYDARAWLRRAVFTPEDADFSLNARHSAELAEGNCEEACSNLEKAKARYDAKLATRT